MCFHLIEFWTRVSLFHFKGKIGALSDLADLLVQNNLYDMSFTILLRFFKGSGLKRFTPLHSLCLSLFVCVDILIVITVTLFFSLGNWKEFYLKWHWNAVLIKYSPLGLSTVANSLLFSLQHFLLYIVEIRYLTYHCLLLIVFKISFMLLYLVICDLLFSNFHLTVHVGSYCALYNI